MNRLLFLFLALPLFFVGGCSDDDDDPVAGGEIKKLILKADKSAIVADGKDLVTFSVTDENGNDLISSCNILCGSDTLFDNTFKTDKAGFYTFVAKHADLNLSSEKVTVEAQSVVRPPVDPADVKIVAAGGKKTVMADGADFVLLSLQNAAGEEVGENIVFYADGTALEGNEFRTTKKGIHKVTAKLDGKEDVKAAPLTLNAKLVTADTKFTGRMYAELFSSTNCPHCGEINYAVDELFHSEDPAVKGRMIPVCVHEYGSSVLLPKNEDFVRTFKDYFKQIGTPKLYVNRSKKDVSKTYVKPERLKDLIPESSDAGIAIKAVQDGQGVKVEAFVHANKNMNGKIAAVLVEEGIKAYTSYEYKGGYHTLVSIMRAYAPSFEGEAISLSPDKAVSRNFTFESGYAKAIGNCAVVVMLMDESGKVIATQRVMVGEAIGY